MNATFIGSMVMIAALAMTVGCAEMGAQEESRPSGGALTSVASAATGAGAMAAGAVGDTLQACLARIPADASAGQRMIAEQSCARDQGDRKLIQAVPGR